MSTVDQAAPELLPCPFCGGPAAFRGAAIRCTSFACNASLSPVWTTAEIRRAKGDHAEKLRIAIEQTAERWNRREAADMAECAAFSAGYEAGEADGRADLAAPSAQPGQDHRSFSDAADGRPLPPMADDLMTAGLNGDDARFVAIQLAQNGLRLTPAPSAPAEVEGLVQRLRGEYRIAITDGLGPAGGDEPDNANEFVRRFEVPQIQIEAATALTALQAENERLRQEAKAERLVLKALKEGAEARVEKAEALHQEAITTALMNIDQLDAWKANAEALATKARLVCSLDDATPYFDNAVEDLEEALAAPAKLKGEV